MLDLPGITLACVDTRNHALALRALERSQRGVRYGRVALLTDAVPPDVVVPDGIEVVAIAPLVSRDDYSRFVLTSLVAHVATTHVLLVQWDGYVVNPGAFDPAFLGCDYIGAKWYWYDDGMRVGNGGFSLRSRTLLDALQDPRIELVDAEDVTIGRTYRPLLEREYGVRFAPEALADRFAFEAAYPAGMPFGFHGLYNFCRTVPPAELAALAPMFSDDIARSLQLGQLVRNCVALAQWAPAAALARRRLDVVPQDTEMRTLLARAEAGLARGPAVGRNDPCPCGSGKRYKQCHGAIATPGAARAPDTPVRVAGTGTAPTKVAGAASAKALAQRGLASHQRGDLASAERDYREALVHDPDLPVALHFLGVVAYQRGRPADALPLLERSARLTPAEPEFHNNTGLALAALDRNDAAIDAYRRALALKPAHAAACNNLGLALQASNRIDEAIDAFRRALAAAPSFAHAHWNLALALLAAGLYDEGFAEYEWRLRLPELGGKVSRPALRRWQGEPLAGKRVLLSTEQAIGDAIQFVRFAPRLAALGAHVVVEAASELRPLLASANGVHETIDGGADDGGCDFELPLLSLPHRLRLGAADIGVNGAYLAVDAAHRRAAEARLASHAPAPLRVGLAWAGSPHHRNDARRSMPLAALAPLFSLPGVTWHSLQIGPAAAQLAQVAEARNVAPLPPDSPLADTAALVDALDAVVTVDTSLAHLAGALGKRVYVLLPFAPDWRWGLAGDRTPWYPTARLVRQSAIGDWRSVVAQLRRRVEGDLQRAASSSANARTGA
jgi:tetratricopeptide (TPR) repeat protein